MEKTMYVIKREDGKFYYKGHVSSVYGYADFDRAYLFETEAGAKRRLYTATVCDNGAGLSAEILPVKVVLHGGEMQKFGWRDAIKDKPEAGVTVLVQDSLGNLALGYVDANGDWWIERYDDEDLPNGHTGSNYGVKSPTTFQNTSKANSHGRKRVNGWRLGKVKRKDRASNRGVRWLYLHG